MGTIIIYLYVSVLSKLPNHTLDIPELLIGGNSTKLYTALLVYYYLCNVNISSFFLFGIGLITSQIFLIYLLLE